MLIAVGYGKMSPSQIVKKLIPRKWREAGGSAENGEETAWEPGGMPDKYGILIHGHDDIMIHMGRCCTPIPGDEVIGYITKGRGVTIHREDCSNVRELDSDRRVEVDWPPTSDSATTYPAKFKVTTIDQPGMLALVSKAVSAGEANIVKAKVNTTMDHCALFDFLVQVNDRGHLRRIFSLIKKIKGVTHVERSLG